MKTYAQLKRFLQQLVQTSRIGYTRKLRLPKNAEWLNTIDFYLPLLSDDFYTLKTKVYWILNDITSFDDPRCICHNDVCRKSGEFRNVANVFDGYKDHCCKQCAIDSNQRKLRYEQTSLKNCGYKNISSAPKTKKKKVEKSLEKFGVDCVSKSLVVQQKIRTTNVKKYGKPHYSQTDEYHEKFKATSLQRFGVEHPCQCAEIRKKQHAKYQFEIDGNIVKFDSAPEVAYYIWLKDNNISFEHEPMTINYDFNGKTHVYMPDFIVEGQLIELKGNQFFKEDGTMQNPYDHSQDGVYEAKHQCMIANNVKILRSNDYQKYVDYVNNKYGKDFLSTLKVS